jgi:polymorphic toxin system DSP-PTPase phosphatase-like protein
MIAGGPAKHGSTRYAHRMLDLSWITDTFAIGGSFSPTEIHLLATNRIAAIVDLRCESCDDQRLLARHGIAFLHVPTLDFAPIGAAGLARGLAFVADHLAAERRVLVHCAKGIGRSALLGLCVLVDLGLAPLDALELAKRRRACLSPSPQQYEAWASWLAAHRIAHGAVWSVPSFDQFKAIAYRHLR